MFIYNHDLDQAASFQKYNSIPDSSAKFYIMESGENIPVMNFRELDDINLNSSFKK